MEDDKPRAPKDTKELFWWLVFEWQLLQDYSDSLTSWRGRWRAIRYPYFLIVVACFSLLLIQALISTGFHYVYTPNSHEQWKWVFWEALGLTKKVYLNFYFFSFAVNLVISLFVNFAFGLRFHLFWSLSFFTFRVFIPIFAFVLGGEDWVFFFIFALSNGLVAGIFGGLGILGALTTGITGYKAEGLILLFLGLVGNNFESLNEILIGGLTFIIMYYRIPFFSWYWFQFIRRKYSLSKNPHRWDYAIYFPIPRLQNKLVQEAVEDPKNGIDFSNFLLQKKRFQNKLAFCLLHASFAGTLRQNRLNFHILNFPELPEKTQTYKPTSRWYTLLQQTRDTLADAQRENNIHARLQYWDIFTQRLQEFKAQTITEPRVWSQYYLPSLEKWEKSAAERRAKLELEAQNAEPICHNIYRGGEKLDPRVDQRIFLGRDDLRDSFKAKVLTAQSMPLFFIQGQRRVGKSSLINFLPEFLGSGFVVVQYDMQEEPGDVLAWLQALRQRFHKQLQLAKEPPEWTPPDDWLDAWKELRAELEELAAKDGRRFVLAIDEYETLHGYLQKDTEQGTRLLSAIRSFSQGQNKVVLLFAGADFFSELKAPNWNEYFPQAVTLYVDYLKRPDAFQLIQAVDLRYPPELLEEMYEQTQGHPALLQKICQEIVSIANTEGRRDITAEDFHRVLTKHILRPVNGVTDVFWGQFCELRGLKPAVRQLINGEKLTDQRALLQLEDHGFIVEKEGRWQMRVPIFEQWVRRYSWRDHPDR